MPQCLPRPPSFLFQQPARRPLASSFLLAGSLRFERLIVGERKVGGGGTRRPKGEDGRTGGAEREGEGGRMAKVCGGGRKRRKEGKKERGTAKNETRIGPRQFVSKGCTYKTTRKHSLPFLPLMFCTTYLLTCSVVTYKSCRPKKYAVGCPNCVVRVLV